MHSRIGLCLLSLFLISSLYATAGVTERVLYSFSGGLDGSRPTAGLLSDSAGNLYGVTGGGGNTAESLCIGAGCGVAFRMRPRGDGRFDYEVIHSFCALTNCIDGAFPSGSLISDSSGNLYGATSSGGNVPDCNGYGCGLIYQLTPQSSGGYKYKVLYAFPGGAMGAFPIDALSFDAAGHLYGAAVNGGISDGSCVYAVGCGLIFALSPNPAGTRWDERVLYTFSGGQDGALPHGGLVFDSVGNLYGVAEAGGRKNFNFCVLITCGVIFELGPEGSGGWSEQTVHAFSGSPDGSTPIGGITIDAENNLYTITSEGGNDTWKFSPDGSGGWTQILVGQSGGGSYAKLLLDSQGNLYGTTASCCAFEFSPDGSGGWTETILYAFCSRKFCTDGSESYAPVIEDAAANLFGTTSLGGSTNNGVVFELLRN